MTVLTVLFWVAFGLLAYTHIGYPVTLWVLGFIGLGNRAGEIRGRRVGAIPPPIDPTTEEKTIPTVTVIIAAYNEEAVIEAKVRDALQLEYPRDLLEVIVASDGSTDRTVEIAREAGADRVLDLPRSGKVAAQNAAAAAAEGEILAFSDANSSWETAALLDLLAPFRDGRVGYVCGQVSFVGPDGGNLEGAYWRYEMKVRELESGLAGVTAGNGAIYAVRAGDYIPLDPSGSHDLSFPFALAKQGRLSLYRPRARATEKVVPSLEGELSRKRRMMIGLWDIVVGEGMVDPRGYPPIYLLEIFSHRILRYLSPLLHLVILVTSAILAGTSLFWTIVLGLQLVVMLAALVGRWVPLLPFRICRYYVMVTLAIAFGLWDRWRQGPPGFWEKAEGTR
ncbi:MAG: glycosyltransferase [Solirubrobacterales bacterium]|nr:glycosyltransferase [Solirubrobacterales bacterium]